MIKHLLFSLFFLFTCSILGQNFDIDALKEINVERNKSLDPTFKFITNSNSYVNIGTPIVVFATGLIAKDSSLRMKGILLAESMFVSTLITTTMKYTIKRDRPFTTYDFIDKQATGGSPSFPSGHTSSAFSTATSLSIAFPKWYVIAPSFFWASSVGYSRMHLGVHYPSDVIVGAVIGSGSAFLCNQVNKWVANDIRKKRKNSVKL